MDDAPRLQGRRSSHLVYGWTGYVQMAPRLPQPRAGTAMAGLAYVYVLDFIRDWHGSCNFCRSDVEMKRVIRHSTGVMTPVFTMCFFPGVLAIMFSWLALRDLPRREDGVVELRQLFLDSYRRGYSFVAFLCWLGVFYAYFVSRHPPQFLPWPWRKN